MATLTLFSNSDISQIEKMGIQETEIGKQITNFRNGFPYLDIQRAATIGDGILRLETSDLANYIKHYEQSLSTKTAIKFVPASGAASRMFKALFGFMNSYKNTEEEYTAFTADTSFNSVYNFFKRLDDFAFFDDLKNTFSEGMQLEELQLKKGYVQILQHLLTDAGLDYGQLPKGLLKFHRYEDGNRTPLEEHLVEGANYANGKGGVVKLHFTVSPDHEEKFKKQLAEVREKYEKQFKVSYEVDFSQQKPSTDTIAVDMENMPFRNADGTILFRPGGHGALIENLNELEADIVFVKNIDNVVPDRLKADTYTYKKALAGLLLTYQEKIFAYLHQLDEEEVSEELLDEIGAFIRQTLCTAHADFSTLSAEDKLSYCKNKLNRPTRICGMVKNEGEPGGGPFWASNPDGTVSLQVVESAQIDLKDEEKAAIVQQATHFNPVDLVCAMKNYKGEQFNLLDFRDPQTGFISNKSKDGRELKAQELPGLWNGAMSDWNTIFVEVPITTFNPVKTVNDLLREQHQG
ncbi:MAG: DUF4301 family protein [Flammeovirgaceae bacterium]